jgi:hypothetical protein
VDKSADINELAAALSKAQASIEPAGKSHVNPAFKSRYADLADIWEACRKPLADHGLAVVQLPQPCDNAVLLATTLIHSSGQWITSYTPLLFDPTKMQSLGSALTYARRYGLAAMVGVVADEDDDGHAAVAPAFPRTVERPEPPRQPAQRAPQRKPEAAPVAGPPPPWNEQYGPPTKASHLFSWAKSYGLEKVVAAIGKDVCGDGRIMGWDDDTVAQVVETIDRDREDAPIEV